MVATLLSPTFLPLFADMVLAGLLVATLVVAIRLNGRLAVLRSDRNRLGELITGLGKASAKAEEAVAGLRVSASESGRGLQERIERAGALAADMNFLIEKAERLADRLEAAFRAEREAAQAARPPLDLETFARAERGPEPAPPRRVAVARETAPRETVPGDPADAQSRLANLLRQAEAQSAAPRAEPALDRRPRAVPQPEPRAAPTAAEPRSALRQSRAERELQRVLDGRR